MTLAVNRRIIRIRSFDLFARSVFDPVDGICFVQYVVKAINYVDENVSSVSPIELLIVSFARPRKYRRRIVERYKYESTTCSRSNREPFLAGRVIAKALAKLSATSSLFSCLPLLSYSHPSPLPAQNALLYCCSTDHRRCSTDRWRRRNTRLVLCCCC